MIVEVGSRTLKILLKGFAATLVAALACGSMAHAQFGLPKLPKIPKLPGQKENKPAQENKVRKMAGLPAPELTAITPDAAPPGGAGELVLTGKNFTPGMSLRFNCKGGVNPHVESLKVEDSGKAVAQVSLAFNAKESPCEMFLERPEGGAETAESDYGSREVFQVPDSGPKFAISNAGGLPVGVDALLLAEGNQEFPQLMAKMQQAMMPGFGEKGQKTSLLFTSDTVKYVRGQATLFSEPTSAVKAVEEMNMMGQSTGIFRIEFQDGKIYNFMGTTGDSKKTAEFVKKRLGK